MAVTSTADNGGEASLMGAYLHSLVAGEDLTDSTPWVRVYNIWRRRALRSLNGPAPYGRLHVYIKKYGSAGVVDPLNQHVTFGVKYVVNRYWQWACGWTFSDIPYVTKMPEVLAATATATSLTMYRWLVRIALKRARHGLHPIRWKGSDVGRVNSLWTPWPHVEYDPQLFPKHARLQRLQREIKEKKHELEEHDGDANRDAFERWHSGGWARN